MKKIAIVNALPSWLSMRKLSDAEAKILQVSNKTRERIKQAEEARRIANTQHWILQ